MRALTAFLAALIALTSVQTDASSGSLALSFDALTNEDYPNVEVHVAPPIDQTLVERGLPWSSESLGFAQKIISSQTKSFEKEISRLASSGAETVLAVSDPQILRGKPYKDASLYVRNLHPWHLEGLNSSGKVIGRSRQFPSDTRDMGNYLVRPKSSRCSVRLSAWWNPFDWFTNGTCVTTQVSASAYLRASLATALKKATIEDSGSWLVPQIDYALASNCELTVRHDELFCDALTQIVEGQRSIKLSGKSKLGGYSISVDVAARKAIYRATTIDQRAIAKGAKVLAGDSYVSFF